MPDDEFTEIESRLKDQFNDLPDDEQLRFFVTTIMLCLDAGQVRNLIKMLQERLP